MLAIRPDLSSQLPRPQMYSPIFFVSKYEESGHQPEGILAHRQNGRRTVDGPTLRWFLDPRVRHLCKHKRSVSKGLVVPDMANEHPHLGETSIE